MSAHIRLLLLGCCAALLLPAGAVAAITSIRGSARVIIEEIRDGEIKDSDEASDTFPGTVTELPIRVSAALRADEPEIGAGGGAAQFADPRTLDQPNPEEFAMNMAISSVTPGISYQALTLTEEIRTVRFSADEAGGVAAGESVEIIGRIFLDGALTIFSAAGVTDVSAANIRLTITIVKESAGTDAETVFSGAVELEGRSDGTVVRNRGGALPTATMLLSDFAPLNPEFGVFQVLIIPPLNVDYTYDAIVEEEFTLRATVRVDASNGGEGVGVAGILGTPVDALEDVIESSNGAEFSQKVVNLVQSARENRSGEPAFVEPVPNLCGLLGLEAVAGLVGLVGVRQVRLRKRRPG